MKIVLFGATGNVGQRVMSEALRRGHEVVGIVRDPAVVQQTGMPATFTSGDATDSESVAHAARGADAIVSAISPRPNAQGLAAPSLVDAARALIAGAKKAGVKRLVVVGGAGSLEAGGQRIVDRADFPDAYKAEALAQSDALKIYRNEAADLDWTYLSPAAEIHSGERTGKYRTTDDELLTDSSGKSTITFEDYAAALIDELERPQHLRKRFGVAY